MKILLTVATSICLAALWAVSMGAMLGCSRPAETKQETTVPFDVPKEQIVKDMQSKWVVLPPQGQLWGFAPDQGIDVTILETKPRDTGYAVYVEMSATSKVTIPEPATEKSTSDTNNKATSPKPATSTLKLSGIARLHYERIANKWHLLDVESVALVVNQSESNK